MNIKYRDHRRLFFLFFKLEKSLKVMIWYLKILIDKTEMFAIVKS